MNYRMLGYLLGLILTTEAALLLAPTVTAVIYAESPFPFLITMAALLLLAIPLVLQKPKNTRIYAREGFVCVSLGWLLLSAFGALPFVLSGAIPHYIDAFFETVSGFTTTGATILSAVEGLPYGILFWRSFTHWIGGMGVLVFVLAVLPSAGGNAIHLMRAEVPGPTKGKLVPRMRQTALILYGIYVAMTVIETVCLCIAGLPFYDALVNSFATAGTGGFGLKNASIAGYASPAAEWIIAIFMLLFGINFNLYFFLLMRRFRDVLKSEELRVYLILCAAAVAVIALNTAHLFSSVGDCIRTAFFQVTAIISTTGFSTVDFNLWPSLSKTVLLLLMVTGAMAGSTAGGLKLSRCMILIKNIGRELRHMLHPRSVNVTRMDGEPVADETCRAAAHYFALYVLLIIVVFMLVSISGLGVGEDFTAALTCINNVGPGLGAVGPAGNFSGYSVFSKIVLSLAMLFGRLEIMPMIILFSPSTWRRR
jgi:trk system potassium uptake protein TrkH